MVTETRTRRQEAAEEKLPSQYVNYAFYKVDPLWRHLHAEEREAGSREFVEAAEEGSKGMLLRSF